MTSQAIFIHSLFRSGSTYFFNVFRRSTVNYWCYQEPLHEAPYLTKADPTALLSHVGSTKELRHPQLDKPYFQELYDVRDAWLDILNKEAIYDHYFTSGDADDSIPFFRALIAAAKGIPLIQECRTSCRIGSLKNALGGRHIYLWRNPWDQWWSYQVNDYFNAVTMLIINASDCPPEIARFRDKIQFQTFYSRNLSNQLKYFHSSLSHSQIRYQAFYLLWCLGLREAMQHADVMVSIDKLSDDPQYRTNVLKAFASMNVQGCDFSDCQIPQAVYTQQDRDFFREQEVSIHQLLLSSGWSQEELDNLHALRHEYLPNQQQWVPQSELEKHLLRDAERSRLLARHMSDSKIIYFNEANTRIKSLQRKSDCFSEDAHYWYKFAKLLEKNNKRLTKPVTFSVIGANTRVFFFKAFFKAKKVCLRIYRKLSRDITE